MTSAESSPLTSPGTLSMSVSRVVAAPAEVVYALGRMRWSTRPTVTEADRGRRFAFHVPSGARSTWTYDLVPGPDGTTVTESVATARAVPLPIRWLMRRAGVTDRAQHLRAGMVTTLDRLAAAAVTPGPADA